MGQEQSKTQEQLSRRPSEEYRKMMTPEDEVLIAEHLREHPTLTRDEVLRELEDAGY
jgi:hypothetical protein